MKTEEQLLDESVVAMKAWVDRLERLILDADKVARLRGDAYGLCDSYIARRSEAYPSQASGDILAKIKLKRGIDGK